MPDIVDFPPNLRITNRSDPTLSFNTRTPGVSIDGSQQIISPLSERWVWNAAIPIMTKEDARAIRIVKSLLKGRFNWLAVRICDQYRITRKDIGAYGGSTHSDGSTFSDGSTYAKSSPTSPIMVAAEENDTSITIRASDLGGYMTAGVFFSINYFLYHIDSWVLDGSNFILEISPPLRQDVTIEDEANFDAVAIWRAEEDAIPLELQIGKYGSVMLNLVEPTR